MPQPCPRCGRRCEPSGELTINGEVMPVYQCDECLEPLDLGDGGDPLEMALTWAIDKAGNVHRNVTGFD